MPGRRTAKAASTTESAASKSTAASTRRGPRDPVSQFLETFEHAQFPVVIGIVGNTQNNESNRALLEKITGHKLSFGNSSGLESHTQETHHPRGRQQKRGDNNNNNNTGGPTHSLVTFPETEENLPTATKLIYAPEDNVVYLISPYVVDLQDKYVSSPTDDAAKNWDSQNAWVYGDRDAQFRRLLLLFTVCHRVFILHDVGSAAPTFDSSHLTLLRQVQALRSGTLLSVCVCLRVPGYTFVHNVVLLQ